MNISDCRTHQLLVITFVKAKIPENLKAMCFAKWRLASEIHTRNANNPKKTIFSLRLGLKMLIYSIRNPCQMPCFKICGSKQK